MNFRSAAEIKAYKTIIEAPDGPRFSERQAQAIIELQLQRLTGMEQQKILEELAEITQKIAEYVEIMGSEKVLKSVIIKELREVQKDFGDERRTQIVEDTGEIKLEDLVQMEDVAVTVTRGEALPVAAENRAASAWVSSHVNHQPPQITALLENLRRESVQAPTGEADQ